MDGTLAILHGESTQTIIHSGWKIVLHGVPRKNIKPEWRGGPVSPNEIIMAIDKRIHKLGIGYNEIARISGAKYDAFFRYRQGESLFVLHNLTRMADALGLEIVVREKGNNGNRGTKNEKGF